MLPSLRESDHMQRVTVDLNGPPAHHSLAGSRITATLRRGLCLLVPRGDLDRSSAGTLSDALRRLREPGSCILVMDLAELGFIDGGGLGLLLDVADSCRDHEWIGILSPSPNTSRLLDLVGLTTSSAVRLFHSEEELACTLPACA